MGSFRRFAWVVAVVGLVITADRAGAGVIVNPSFESGLAGWTANPPAGLAGQTDFWVAVDPVNDPDLVYNPTDGALFGFLISGEGDVYTTLSQTFTADAGETLTGDIFFDAGDELPFNDDGYARIYNADTDEILFQADVASVGAYGQTPWTEFSYTFEVSGAYTIEFGVRSAIDEFNQSFLGIDNLRLTSAVPEPTTLAGAGLGLVLAAGARWRPRRTA